MTITTISSKLKSFTTCLTNLKKEVLRDKKLTWRQNFNLIVFVVLKI